jgi:hypothetical protein
MKARTTDTGTKYLAISCSLPEGDLFAGAEIFLLIMPSRHLFPASKTPDAELPVVATSLITVENLLRISKGSNVEDKIWERAVPSGIATIPRPKVAFRITAFDAFAN